MDFPCGLFMGYFAFLSIITTRVHSLVIKSVESMDSNNTIVCEKVRPGNSRLGDGIEVDYHPYIVFEEIDDDPLWGMPYTVYKNHANDNCTSVTCDLREIRYVNQVSEEKLMIVSVVDGESIITSVDMNTCTFKDIHENVQKIKGSWKFRNLIHYVDGFDVIFMQNSTRIRVSYDLDGNQIGQPKPFLLKYEWEVYSNFKVISPKSRTSNIIAKYVEADEYFISLLDADGKLIKHLFQWKFDEKTYRIDEIGNSLFAYCKNYDGNKNRMECVQFDEFGNEIYRNTTSVVPDDSALAGLRNLKGGGVVLFTYTTEEIRAIEMRPGKVIEKSYPWTSEDVDEMIVTDFNEPQTQFTARLTRIQTDREGKVCWQALSFPSTFQ